jgi:glycosyl transferase family 1
LACIACRHVAGVENGLCVMRETIVISGALGQRAGRAGHAWVFLNWMLGFRRLGHDVVFVDRLDSTMGNVDRGVSWVRDVMEPFGFGGCWSVLLDDGSCAGIPRGDLEARASGALLVNVMGYLTDPTVFAAVDRRVFLDIDPGFGQCWQHADLATLFADHDVYATVGLNVGSAGCRVPELGLDWLVTLPPVDLEAWAYTSPTSERFTTVGSWRGPFAPVALDGELFGLRVHQARAYAGLPALTGAWLEAALDIDRSDDADLALLRDGGWHVADPTEVAADVHVYRHYITDSMAEFAIAKQVYVALRSGWFSDRSACYLATGRAVVVSDTGLADHLPLGDGLLTFANPDEAAAAVAEVRGDPRRHARAARELAEEHFDAARVAQRLLERAA